MSQNYFENLNFKIMIMNFLNSYNWTNISNFKRFEESYESSDVELVAIVCSESALRQVHDRCFKVNLKRSSPYTLIYNEN